MRSSLKTHESLKRDNKKENNEREKCKTTRKN